MNLDIKTLVLLVFFILLLPSNAYAFKSSPDLTGPNSWAISFDNDLLSPITSSDQDFTGGLSFSYRGTPDTRIHATLDAIIGATDRVFLWFMGERHYQWQSSTIELGTYGFTPGEVEQYKVDTSDRPYASLIYLSLGRNYINPIEQTAWISSLTVGILGLDIFADMQNGIHELTKSDPANGWSNQISAGGELTARMQLAYMDYWGQGDSTHPKFKTTYFASAGYITEAGVALSTSTGLINNPSNRFNPELISYGERVNDIAPAPTTAKGSGLWAGAALKLRLYNAFLQGQFRESVHTIDTEDVARLIMEAWVGYTYSINPRYSLSYFLRWQSPEIRKEEADRDMVWGALVLSHRF